MPLGAVAEITVRDPKALGVPLLHRLPTSMMIERLRMDLAWEAARQAATVVLR
jgi:hypothetical protein